MLVVDFSSARGSRIGRLIAVGAVAAVLCSCSVRKFAVRQVGDALSSGVSVYETDEDVELVGEALPFSLKLVESLLEVTPRHVGLLTTAAKGFALYSFAYVDAPGEMLIDEDFEEGTALRKRARRLYLRSLDFAMRALEVKYPGFGEQLRQDPAAASGRVAAKHQELLYWAGAGMGLSIAVDPTDPAMVVRLAEVEALLDRALAIDPSWDRGSLHEFTLRLEAARPGGNAERIEQSYEAAVRLSDGQRAGVFVAYAESHAVPNQDRELFEALIGKALAVDPDARKEDRLLNLLAQRRARWLMEKVDDLFF